MKKNVWFWVIIASLIIVMIALTLYDKLIAAPNVPPTDTAPSSESSSFDRVAQKNNFS